MDAEYYCFMCITFIMQKLLVDGDSIPGEAGWGLRQPGTLLLLLLLSLVLKVMGSGLLLAGTLLSNTFPRTDYLFR